MVASLLCGQFAWRSLYDGQLSRGQFAAVSCRVLSGVAFVLFTFYKQLRLCQASCLVHMSSVQSRLIFAVLLSAINHASSI